MKDLAQKSTVKSADQAAAKKTAPDGREQGMYLELRNVSKAFPGVQALKDISFRGGKAGKVLALLGENGAGKSTLFKDPQRRYQAGRGGASSSAENRSGSQPRFSPSMPGSASSIRSGSLSRP